LIENELVFGRNFYPVPPVHWTRYNHDPCPFFRHVSWLQ